MSGFADKRSQEEMQFIAASKLNAAAVKALDGTPAKKTVLLCVADDEAYSIFAPAEESGFVIVAKSTQAEPVIGYSIEHFDANNMPLGLKWYLGEVSRNLQDMEAGRHRAPRRTASFTPVENFITTTWSQEYPFDRKTPNNYPAGCVATALAQCLNYFQYPNSAEFDATYYVTTTSGKKTSTEKRNEHISSTYSWPYKNTYKTFGNYGDNIPELLRDCGYATYMDYSKSGSGTQSNLAAIALTKNFGYPEECVKFHDRSCIDSQETWDQIIYDELAQKCPIIYGAHDSSFGGHAFLFSGVDADGLVYVNWGWRGSADGFYSLEYLTPTQGNDNMNFTNYQRMVYGIRPTPLPTDHIEGRIWSLNADVYTFYWDKVKDEDEQEHNTLFCNIPYGFINMNASDFKGVFGLFADDLTDGTSWVIAPELQDRDTIPAGYYYGGTSEQYKDFAFYYYIDGEKGLKPGHTYRMSFGVKDDYDITWRSILCTGGELAYDITYTGDIKTSTISETATTRPLLTGIEQQRWSTTEAYSSDNVTRVYDLSGRIIYTTPTSQFNLWNIPAHGTFIVRQGQQSRKVVR